MEVTPTMIAWIKRLLGFGPLPPRYRLRPTTRGDQWCLDEWKPDVQMYLCIAICKDVEEADQQIANLNRDTVYWREENEEF